MKQRFTTLIVLAGLVTMLAGCSETFNMKKGDQVRFTVSAMGNPSTKTSYAGYSDGNAFEKINWVSGDNIRIFTMNPEIVKANWVSGAAHPDYYDYKISSVRDSLERYSKGTLTWGEQGAGEGYGLVWVDSPKGATFYGVYPSAEPQYDQTDATKIVAFSGMTIPASQGATPNMKSAYMISEPSVYKDSGYFDAYGQSIPAMEMKFYPFFNAFYIELKSDSENGIKINSVTLSSSSKTYALSGAYKYMFTNNNGIPAVANVTYNSSDVDTYVTANLSSMSDTDRTATSSHAVGVTLLTLPPMSSTGLTNMTLTVNYDNNKSKSLALNNNVSTSNPTGTPISFKPFYKTRITGLAMKGGTVWKLKVDAFPWQKIEQETTFSQNIQAKAFAISNCTENKAIWSWENSGEWNNNYYPSGTKNYQNRTLDMSKNYGTTGGQPNKPYYEVQFTPMAPVGGYWQLIPESNSGMGTAAFKVEVWNEDSGGSSDLKGHIMNQPVTLRITSNVTDDQRTEDHAIIIKGIFSTSVSFDENSTFSADSEIQDAHKDGSFSYWRFVIPAKTN